MGHETAGRNGDLAHVGGFTLGHAKTAGLFSRGGKLRWHLAAGVLQWPPNKGEGECSTGDEQDSRRTHVPDAITVSWLAATDTTA